MERKQLGETASEQQRMMERNDLIRVAETAINQVLKNLEMGTGQLVDRLELVKIDTTRMMDDRQRLNIGVRIHLIRSPGHDWE